MFGDTGYEDYITVAASQTKQQIGAATSTGGKASTSIIKSVTIVPATTSPGIVEIYDTTGGTAIVLFTGGSTSVADLKPFTLFFQGLRAQTGPWFITTGANVSAIVNGRII